MKLQKIRALPSAINHNVSVLNLCLNFFEFEHILLFFSCYLYHIYGIFVRKKYGWKPYINVSVPDKKNFRNHFSLTNCLV